MKRGLISEGKPSFWQESRDTFKMNHYGWGCARNHFHSKFPCCFQLVLLVRFKSRPGFFHCCWKPFPPQLPAPLEAAAFLTLANAMGVVLKYECGDGSLCRSQATSWACARTFLRLMSKLNSE